MENLLLHNHRHIAYDPKSVSFHWTTISVEDDDSHFRAFQFTQPAAVASMLESNEVWATSILSLNDPTELAYGMALFRARWEQVSIDDLFYGSVPQMEALINRLESSFLADEECYVASASTIKRSIAQYSLYGPARVEIDPQVLLQPIGLAAQQSNLMPYAGGRTWPWQRVRYSERDKVALIDMMLAVMQESAQGLYVHPQLDRAGVAEVLPSLRAIDEQYWFDRAKSYYANAVCFVKTEPWSYESEIRLLSRLPVGDAARHVRESERGLRSYIRMAPLPPVAQHSPGALFRSVGLGPVRGDRTRAVSVLTTLARTHDIPFDNDNIPYRP